ncbi:MAG: SCO family protein [Elusimicrobia bacterium]|nr:SCO family protein [Elusimicrobiota bacterium]
MMTGTRAKLVAAGAVLFAALAAYSSRRPPPRLAGPVDFSSPQVGSAALRGRPWVADFVFTSCTGPCPMLSANMARLQKRLPAEVRLVSFTVDPDHDDAQALADYALRFGAEPGRWFFARLEAGPLFELVNAGFRLPIYVDPKAPRGSRVIHTTKLVLLDGLGTVRGYYDGLTEAGLRALERDARALLSPTGARRPDV